MATVLLDMSLSLDGFVAAPDNFTLHDWYFAEGDEVNVQVIRDSIAQTGAMVMGRRAYDEGERFDGFVDNPYAVPHFVVSHSVPERFAKGNTPFVFVADGIESAIAQAKATAGDRTVVIGGGASIAQQALEANLVDEIMIHLVPILLGDGTRLFEELGRTPIELQAIQVIPSTTVTHLRFRIVQER